MNISRREFGRKALLLPLAVAIMQSAGCSLSSALTEADNILALISPLGDGVAAIIDIADPALAPAVTAATAIYDIAVKAVEGFLSKWATASATAQPGILSQAQAAVQALAADATNLIAAARVTDATTAAEVAAITAAITGELSALLTVIPQIGAMGGTSFALGRLAVRKGFKTYGPSAKSVRSELAKRMSEPTGKPIDAARAALAVKLKSLQLK